MSAPPLSTSIGEEKDDDGVKEGCRIHILNPFSHLHPLPILVKKCASVLSIMLHQKYKWMIMIY